MPSRFRRWKNMAFLLPLAFGSSAWAKRPAWIQGDDPRYPDNVYVTGVGVGSDLDGARSSARAEISRTFRARVEQVTAETQSESSTSTDGKRGPAEGKQAVEMKTKVSTESLLEGVRIAETWYDKSRQKHYALAVLNKAKARSGLASQIAENEAAVRTHLDQAGSAATPLEKARSYSRALAAGRERDALAARRRILDPVDAPESLADPSTPDIEKSLAETLSRVPFVLQADGDGPDSRLREAVAGEITAMGFQVVDSTAASSGPALVVRCRLKLEPFDRGNSRWTFFRWNGSAELLESGPAGKVLAAATPSGSEGHPQVTTAHTKTRLAGEQAMATIVREQISRYIFGW